LFLNQNVQNLVRIAQDNTWVVLALLLCVFALVFMMNVVQREANIKDFLFQKYFDSPNNFASWIIVSVVVCICLSVLISQYIPTTPQLLQKWSVFGVQLNKFGFTFLVISLFYFVRTFLSFLFYQSTGNAKRWPLLYFTSTKFFFIFALVLIIGCVANYFYPVDREIIFKIFLSVLGFVFVFKLFFYLLHKNDILPQKWYYKILYICTLQIAPLLVVWRLLFF
jgi:hypothetical protein